MNELFLLWRSLMEDCQTGVPAKEFNNRQKDIANRYKRLAQDHQGEYHAMIARDHREWMEREGLTPEY